MFIGSAMLDIQCVSLERPWALWVSHVSLAGYQSSLHLVFFFGSFRTGEELYNLRLYVHS